MSGPTPRMVMAGALALVAGCSIAVVASAHISRSSTSLVITMSPSDDYVYGAVSSPKADCEPRRKVSLYRKREGADRLIGSARSDEGVSGTGPYTVTTPNTVFAPGTYYSKARKKHLAPGTEHDHICRQGRSPGVAAGP